MIYVKFQCNAKINYFVNKNVIEDEQNKCWYKLKFYLQKLMQNYCSKTVHQLQINYKSKELEISAVNYAFI